MNTAVLKYFNCDVNDLESIENRIRIWIGQDQKSNEQISSGYKSAQVQFKHVRVFFSKEQNDCRTKILYQHCNKVLLGLFHGDFFMRHFSVLYNCANK